MTWIHLAFLFVVTLVPFSTRLLADFTGYRAALIVYWFNILLFGIILYAAWGRARQAGLIKSDLSFAVQAAICHRITIGQGLYAFGALLSIFSTYLSIGFIVLVQLNFAIAPGLWRRRRNETAD